MKIKKKMIEIKNKAVGIYKENQELVLGAAVFVGTSVCSYAFGYIIGRFDGSAKGYKMANDESFGDMRDENGDVVWVRNPRTSVTEAYMSQAFYDVMTKNSSIVKYDDGSWNFMSEVE